MARNKRRHYKVHELPPEVQAKINAVLSDPKGTYKQARECAQAMGSKISETAIRNFWTNLQEELHDIDEAREKFMALCDASSKYPGLDPALPMALIASESLYGALSQMTPEAIASLPPDKILALSERMIRTQTYMQRVGAQNKQVYEAGLDEFGGKIYDAMRAKNPQLFELVMSFLKEQKNAGAEGLADIQTLEDLRL